jgi:hypothetical protein
LFKGVISVTCRQTSLAGVKRRIGTIEGGEREERGEGREEETDSEVKVWSRETWYTRVV